MKLSKNKLLLVLLGLFCLVKYYYFFINLDLIINSDISSDLIYANLLVSEKTLLSTSWYYSTSVNIVRISTIQALLFMITNNWHLVRLFSMIVCDILMYLSIVFTSKKLKLNDCVTTMIAFVFIGTLSFCNYRFLLKETSYSIKIIIIILTIGMFIDLANNFKPRKIITVFTLSCLFNLDGIRNLATNYAPMFGTALLFVLICYIFKISEIRELSIKQLKSASVIFAGSIVGFVLNKLYIVPRVDFDSEQFGLTLEPMKKFGSTFLTIMQDGWLTLFGVEGSDIISLICTLLFASAVVALLFVLFNKKYDLNEKAISVMFLASAAITCGCFFITSIVFTTRYLIQTYIFIIFVIGIFLSKEDNKTCTVIMVLFIVLSMCKTFISFNKDLKNSGNVELVEIKNVLVENKVREGFGSFWNANVITEMSDGYIDVWCYDSSNDNSDIYNLYPWLQKKTHFEEYPETPFFLIIRNENLENGTFHDYEDYIKYYGKTKSLLIFNSYEQYDSTR